MSVLIILIGIVAMRGFLERFGDTVENGAPALKSGTLSLLASIVQVGELIGSLLATVVGGVSGRRGGLVVACALVSLGCIIQISATTSIPQMTVGRLVLGKLPVTCFAVFMSYLSYRYGYRADL
jgi:SP family sugar:H+ symporter-like MFS transporter